MTEQEAIEKLKCLPTPMFDNRTDEAKRMAIKALEKQAQMKEILSDKQLYDDDLVSKIYSLIHEE